MAKVLVERELTPEDLEGIVTTAIEGGVNHWASISDVYDSSATTVADDTVLFVVREREGQGGPMTVTPQVIADGISRVMAGVPATQENTPRAEDLVLGSGWQFAPRLFADMEDLGAMDADEADWVIQLGLFGQLVFG